MGISEKKMKIVIDNYFHSECNVNTSIRSAFEKGFRIGVEKGLSAQPEPKWIPCMERLPEENGEYLVVREAKGIYKYVDIVKKTNTSGDIASDIIAWMPLPEPYREEGEK